MAKLFYDHLIIIEEITAVLDVHDISPTERNKLLAMIDETFHNHILDVILTHLPRAHHEEFLHKLTTTPYDTGIIMYLNEKTGKDMEKEILTKVNFVKRQILREIQKFLS